MQNIIGCFTDLSPQQCEGKVMTVRINNGRCITGRIISTGYNTVEVESKGHVIGIPATKIVSITKQSVWA